MLRKHDELTKGGLKTQSTIKIKLRCLGESLCMTVGHLGDCGNLCKCKTPGKIWMLHFSLPEIWPFTISLVSLFFFPLNALSIYFIVIFLHGPMKSRYLINRCAHVHISRIFGKNHLYLIPAGSSDPTFHVLSSVLTSKWYLNKCIKPLPPHMFLALCPETHCHPKLLKHSKSFVENLPWVRNCAGHFIYIISLNPSQGRVDIIIPFYK